MIAILYCAFNSSNSLRVLSRMAFVLSNSDRTRPNSYLVVFDAIVSDATELIVDAVDDVLAVESIFFRFGVKIVFVVVRVVDGVDTVIVVVFAVGGGVIDVLGLTVASISIIIDVGCFFFSLLPLIY